MVRVNARSRFMLLHKPIRRIKHDLNWFRALEGWYWNAGSLPSRIDLPVQRNHGQIHPTIHTVLANCLLHHDRMLWRLLTFNCCKSIWLDLPATITITRPAAHALCLICISTHSSCTGNFGSDVAIKAIYVMYGNISQIKCTMGGWVNSSRRFEWPVI
jgi:hypothetical protein